jgi:hypothetical protein
MTTVDLPTEPVSEPKNKARTRKPKAAGAGLPVLRPLHWPRVMQVADRIGCGGLLDDNAEHPSADDVLIFLDLVQPIAIAVAFESTYEYEATVRLQGEVEYMAVEEVEAVARLMRLISRKIVPPMRDREDRTEWEPLSAYLPRLLQGLGVSECMQRIPGSSVRHPAPVYLYVADLLKDANRRLARIATYLRGQ